MGKKIKFPLEMSDGYKVRTIEELQAHGDSKSIIEYFLNGKLKTWLKDRYYKDEVSQIEKLNQNDENLLSKIYDILKINCKVNNSDNTQIKKIIQEQEKMKKIKQYTDNQKILENIDCVAMSQKEFETIIKNQKLNVYLLGEKFVLPTNIKNINIKGINKVEIKVNSKKLVDFKKDNIYFENCCFDSQYEALIEEKRIEEENAHKKKKNSYKPSKVCDYLLSDSDRKKSALLFDEIQKGLGDFEFDIDVYGKDIRKVLQDADIVDIFDIDKFGKDIKDVLKNSDLDELGEKFFERI